MFAKNYLQMFLIFNFYIFKVFKFGVELFFYAKMTNGHFRTCFFIRRIFQRSFLNSFNCGFNRHKWTANSFLLNKTFKSLVIIPSNLLLVSAVHATKNSKKVQPSKTYRFLQELEVGKQKKKPSNEI